MGTHDDGRDVLRITQAQVMRAVSNPARMRVLALLRERGEQTVGQVCDVLGMPAGSASYHLHRLADAGLVERVGREGADGRQSWWKATHSAMSAAVPTTDSEGEEASEAYRRTVAITYEQAYERYLDASHDLPAAWREAEAGEDRVLRLTPDELTAIAKELSAVMDRWSERAAAHTESDGSEPVVVVMQAYRWVP